MSCSMVPLFLTTVAGPVFQPHDLHYHPPTYFRFEPVCLSIYFAPRLGSTQKRKVGVSTFCFGYHLLRTALVGACYRDCHCVEPACSFHANVAGSSNVDLFRCAYSTKPLACCSLDLYPWAYVCTGMQEQSFRGCCLCNTGGKSCRI